MAVPPPDETPPSDPPSFVATPASGSQIDLSWGASTDNKGVTGYYLQRCQPGSCIATVWLPTTPRTYSSTGLTSGVTYTYYLSATDAAGNQSNAVSRSATTLDNIPPSTPGGLSASAASGSQINLSWSASSDNVGVNGYAIEYCAGSGCSPTTALATTGSTGYSATGLSQATSYSFRVRAYDAQSNYSGYSGNASATTPDTSPPSTPASLSASAASGTQIALSWPASSDNVGVVAYDIEYCAGSGCSPVNALTSTGSTSYSATGLSPATSYSFRVRARDARPNYGGYSPTASATTVDTIAPSTPTAFTATTASGTQINLSWAASSDNVGVSGYTIEYCAGAGCAPVTGLTSTSATSYSATGLTPAITYNFRIRAYDAQTNYSGYSATASAITQDSLAPTAPTGLSATAASSSQVNLNWTASSDNVGVAAYHIERCAGGACSNFAEIATTSSTSYNNTGLADATTYRYQVRARDGFPNYSGYSAIAAAPTPDGTAPSLPAGFTTPVVSATQISFTWTASTDNVGVTGYAVERCQGAGCTNFAQIATPTTNSFTDSTVSSGPTYRYQVRARDAIPNWSGYSSIVSATTTDNQAPSQPSGVTASVTSSTQINLTWTASTDNVAVAGYNIERCTGSACTNYAEIGTSTSASFNNTGLTAGTTYRYRVRARDAVPLFSSYSTVVNATTATDAQAPTAPTGLSATPASPTQVNLSWTASTDNVAVTGYEVQRCQGSGCTSFTSVATPTGTTYNDTGRVPNTIYRYQVRARDAVPNWSSFSAIASATTPADTSAPSVPTALTATAASPTQLNVSWTASSDNVAVTGYELQRCQGASCTTFATIATPSGSSHNDTGRAPNTAYRYQVRARDAVPNWSAYSAIAAGTTQADTTAPTAPGNLRSPSKTADSVSLAWDASTDNVGVSTYRIQRCTGAGCNSWAEISSTPAATTTFTSSGLTQLTTYRFRVGARDGASNTTYTSPFSVTTNDGQAPTSPGGLTLTVVPGQIALQWNASTDNVGVTAYLVERCNSASCTYAQIASVGALTFADTTVGSGTNYSYRVAARDAQGNVSGYSTVGSALAADCD
jgi:fibronectin type 3 domain-containing protein